MFSLSISASVKLYSSISRGVPAILTPAAISATSSLLAGEAAMAAGNYQQTMHERNATILDTKAEQSTKLGEFNVKKFDQVFAKIQASTEAAYMAAGVRMAGTPLEILEYNLTEAEMERENIRYSSKVDSYDFKQQSVLSRMQGNMAMFQARQQRASAFMNAAGTMVSFYGAKTMINTQAASNKLIVDTMNANTQKLITLQSNLGNRLVDLTNSNRLNFWEKVGN